MAKKRDYRLESKLRRIGTKEWYDALLQNYVCEHCGNGDYRTFEWHHLDPSKKDMNVSRMLTRKARPAILAEIKKCICLCANCHRILHYKEKGKIRKKSWNGPILDI